MKTIRTIIKFNYFSLFQVLVILHGKEILSLLMADRFKKTQIHIQYLIQMVQFFFNTKQTGKSTSQYLKKQFKQQCLTEEEIKIIQKIRFTPEDE